MSAVVDVQCWRVYGWGRGRWTLRSTHDSPLDAAEHAEALHYREHIITRVQQATTRRAVAVQAHAPTAAREFREQQSDRMVIRRQTHAYFKSGSNGTEILYTPEQEREA